MPLKRIDLRYFIALGLGVIGVVFCALTQSRGPLLAEFIASLIGMRAYRQFALPPRFFWYFVVLALVIGLFTLGPAAGERVRTSFSRDDASIGNRLLIWRASFSMFGLNPINGIGWGEAGNYFSQWYQPESLQYRYTGIFNEYLQLGVEQGLPILLFALGSIFLVVLLPSAFCHRESGEQEAPVLVRMAFCAYLSLLVVTMSGLFSLLREAYTLRFIVLANLVVLAVYLTIKLRNSSCKFKPTRLLTLSFAAASLCIAVVLFLGQKTREPLEISWMGGNAVRIRKVADEIASLRSAAVFVDQEIVGRLYGKEIRRWLLASDKFNEFVVFDPRFPVSSAQVNGCSALILIGRCGRFAQQVDAKRVKTLILIHPSLAEIDLQSLRFPATIYLPEICEDGTFHTLSDTPNSKLSFVSTGALSNSLLGLNLKLSP